MYVYLHVFICRFSIFIYILIDVKAGGQHTAVRQQPQHEGVCSWKAGGRWGPGGEGAGRGRSPRRCRAALPRRGTCPASQAGGAQAPLLPQTRCDALGRGKGIALPCPASCFLSGPSAPLFLPLAGFHYFSPLVVLYRFSGLGVFFGLVFFFFSNVAHCPGARLPPALCSPCSSK